MIELHKAADLRLLRRLALAAQGLAQARAFGRGLAATRRAIQHLGYVQIDTISVVERAHHHVLHSRVPDYRPAWLDTLLGRRQIFEYWAHAAAFLPIEDFRYSLPYKLAIRGGQVHWFRAPDHKLMRELLARIRAEGPLRSADLESGANGGAGWWDWKPAKKALEQLYMQGDLMVCDRRGFHKRYDLCERVLPADIDTRPPTTAEFAEHLLTQQLRCHGLVSLKGLTYLRRDPGLRAAMKSLVQARQAAGELEAVSLPGGAVFLLPAGALDSAAPRLRRQLRILSPFDNSLIQRERLRDLFAFDYQIECYVPAAKRRYGYFCLPLLLADRFVGRMDCKAHRQARRLEIIALHLEDGAGTEAGLPAAFAAALADFARFQDCDTVSLTAVRPARLAPALRAALAEAGCDDRG